ncbi:MAG: M20 family metallo-hydrolase [Flavihumibacter sp.]|nr:M20 family metallo-hydrolase [Flavihumibacter sp.]
MSDQLQILQQDAIELLKKLIATPSFSKEEDNTAALLEDFLERRGITTHVFLKNVWAKNKYFDESKPSILLNSHHDTVKPNKGYTLDPFSPIVKDEKLFGLGSNDAGGCLVSLMAVFRHFYHRQDLNYNVVLAATAEEEISGHNGIEALLPRLPKMDFGIVGEPTQMHMAVAEKGLMVLDALAIGKAGHAAREEGESALYKAVKDIEWIIQHRFEKVSPLLGPVKMSVTVIETENKQHNVVPAQCKYVIDCRVNELYTFEEILEVLQANLKSELKPRSTRLRSSSIPLEHPLIQTGIAMGREYYGSPTTSDKALMNFSTLKMGPGDSARSHTADEFIYLKEIEDGIAMYIELLEKVIVRKL